MKAMVYTAPKELKILDVDVPAPAPGEVLVKVAGAGICGSELEGFATVSPRRVPPLILGHEFGGTVAELGPGAQGFAVGDRVVVNPMANCGRCDLCLRGKGSICRHRSLMSMHRPGAFAEYVTAPVHSLYPMPGHFSTLDAVMVEPAANAVHAVERAAEPAPQNVCIFGAGTIGLLCAQVARVCGAPRVMLVDISDHRLEIGRRVAADATVNPKATDLREAALDFTHGVGFDYCIDAVGAAGTRADAAAIARPGGAAVWVGLHSLDATPSGLDLVTGEKTIYGSYGYLDADFRKGLSLLEAGKLNVESWSRHFPLAEGVGVFQDLLGGQTEHVKAVLVP